MLLNPMLRILLFNIAVIIFFTIYVFFFKYRFLKTSKSIKVRLRQSQKLFAFPYTFVLFSKYTLNLHLNNPKVKQFLIGGDIILQHFGAEYLKLP